MVKQAEVALAVGVVIYYCVPSPRIPTFGVFLSHAKCIQ